MTIRKRAAVGLGATKLSVGETDRLTAPYQGRCIGAADISGLLKALTNTYLDKGFVTSRAYVPPQDIAGRQVLKLTVVEGTISDIYLNGKPNERDGTLATAFPGMKGRVANIRGVEQGLDPAPRR